LDWNRTWAHSAASASVSTRSTNALTLTLIPQLPSHARSAPEKRREKKRAAHSSSRLASSGLGPCRGVSCVVWSRLVSSHFRIRLILGFRLISFSATLRHSPPLRHTSSPSISVSASVSMLSFHVRFVTCFTPASEARFGARFGCDPLSPSLPLPFSPPSPPSLSLESCCVYLNDRAVACSEMMVPARGLCSVVSAR